MTFPAGMNTLLLACGLMFLSIGLAQDAALDPPLAAAERIYRQDGPAAALPEFQRLLEAYQEQDDLRNVAITQGYIGALYWRLGEFELSRRHLDEALRLKRDIGDRLEEARTLNVLGLLEWDLGHYPESIEHFRAASAVAEQEGDRKLAGATLNNLSLVYDELGDYERSLEQYQRALRIYADIDFPRGKGDTLGNLGGVYLLLGYFGTAADYYHQALNISEELNSVAAMSQDHGNLGLAYTGLGQTDTALRHFDQALEMAEQAGLSQEQGIWLRGKANAQIMAGRYDLGLENHRAALEILTDVESQPLLLDTLHDLGELHLELGDPITAEQYFRRAMTTAESVGMPRAVSTNLLSLGDLQYRHQRFDAALDFYRQALDNSGHTGEKNLHISGLLGIARVRLDREQFEQAQQALDTALELSRETGALGAEAEALILRGDVLRIQHRNDAAIAAYDAAQLVADQVGDPDPLWRLEYGRGLSLAESGQKEAAVTSLLAAARRIEGVRSRLKEKRFRAGYIQDKHQVYIELVRLQLELGRTSDAFSTAERLRTWRYIEQSGYDVALELPEDRKKTGIELRERIRQLQRSLERERDQIVPDQRQLAIATFSRELLLAEQQYQAFLDDLESSGTIDSAGLTPLSETEARARLGPREALLEYVVGKELIMVFVLTGNRLRAMSIPARQEDLHTRLDLLRDMLALRGDALWRKPAASLSDTLIRPILEKGWIDNVKHIYLVPHGMLNYLPFALLPMEEGPGYRPLIDMYTLAYLPSASMLGRSKDRQAQPSVLAMAPARSRLKYAPEEVSSISELFAPKVHALLGTEATESTFKSNAGGYQVLHLATHGYFNGFNPLLSGLQLEPDHANDGLLEVHEILELDLDSELVTLSACETGLASGYFNELPAGDDFVGMTRAFLQVGSDSVFATLWEVDDRSTVELMKNFYATMEASGNVINKADALVSAQQLLRRSEQFHHPYYWAPFVLVGEMHREHEAQI